MALNQQQVIEAAFTLLNDNGLSGVSLRNLAELLKVKAPSLAWHITNKSTLLALMNQSLFYRVFETIPPCTNARDWLLEFGNALWRMQCSVRDSAALLNAMEYHPDISNNMKKALVQHLQKHGLTTPAGMQAQSAVQALILGWSTFYQSQQMPYIAEQINVDETITRSLRALVDGMAAQSSNFGM